MAFLGFFNVYSLRVNLSVGIVAMTEKRPIEFENGTIGYVSVVICRTEMEGRDEIKRAGCDGRRD